MSNSCCFILFFSHLAQGTDLVHDSNSPVRILDYYVRYGSGIPHTGLTSGGVGTTLHGIVHYTPRAESHAGFCHGGSMCSVMDDVIGWVAFCVTGRCIPWTGFTVQVNTSLKRPIRVNSILLVKAEISQVERRKVSVLATIVDPSQSEGPIVHAEGSGLVVMNRGILPEEQEQDMSSLGKRKHKE